MVFAHRGPHLSRAIPRCATLARFLIEEWPRLQAKWEAWADAATDADLARQVPFKSRFVGNAGLPAWQIVMHVVNHGRLHRGQIVGMLRQLGVKPPATDIVFLLLLGTKRGCRELTGFAAPEPFAGAELAQSGPEARGASGQEVAVPYK